MNIDWDAREYSRAFSFVPQYGEEVLKLLDTGTANTVVDLGCGNGRLTMRLAEMGMRAIGIDASEDMLAIARSSYPELEFAQSDALDFTVQKPVDAVFSNAVFHWIDKDKQPLLLKQINRALKAGGELVCEFGGKGCAAQVHEALRLNFEKAGMKYFIPFYFPSIGEYAVLLEKAGFRVVYALLFDRPTICSYGESGLRKWIRMFDKIPFRTVDAKTENDILAGTEHTLRSRLFQNGSWRIDYVRIRLKAIKEYDI